MFLPLHRYIFSILEKLDTDGTMDQHGALHRLVDRLGQTTKYYCYDLSAATDRLPVEIQSDILSCIGVKYNIN
jgi:hypothetical protein